MANLLPVPESEQRVLDNLLRDLNDAYPDKVIVRLQQDHKKWYEKVTRLYKNIGYENRNDFLEAYGFSVEQSKSGRPTVNLETILEELVRRYEGDKFVSSVAQLKEENPDLAKNLKSLQNKSKEMFGVTFNDLMREKGIFKSNNDIFDEKTEIYKEKLERIIKELKNRYKDKELPVSIAAMKEENADIEEIANIIPWIARVYDKPSKEYLKEIGLLQDLEARVNNIIDALIKRYEAKEPENSISSLINNNNDLKLFGIKEWIKDVYGVSADEYLAEKGLLPMSKTARKDFLKLPLNEQIEILAKKYEGKLQKPTGIPDLSADNLDLPIETFYRKLKKSVESPYSLLVDRGVLTPFYFTNGMITGSYSDVFRRHKITRISIPDGTTGILGQVFNGCQYVEEISIPDSVKYIGFGAFQSFSFDSLKTIKFGNGIRELSHDVFTAKLGQIEELVLPRGIEAIHGNLFVPYAFNGTFGETHLKRIVISGIVKSFAGDIFSRIPNNIMIDCPEEMLQAIAQNTGDPESDFYIWDESSNTYMRGQRPRFDDEQIMIQKYGVKDDNPYADVQLFDSVEEIDLKGKSITITSIISDRSISEMNYDDTCVNSDLIRSAIRKHGGIITESISQNTDILIADKTISTDKDRKAYNAVRYREQSGKPLIIEYGEFIRLFERAYPDSINNLRIERIDKAVEIYENCMKKIWELEGREYNSPTVIEGYAINPLNADAISFYEEIIDNYESESCSDSYDYQYTPDKLLSLWKNEKSIGEAHIGFNFALGIFVASIMFGFGSTNDEIVFARDKWEYRMDYSSSTRLAIKAAPEGEEWKVYKKTGYDVYDM